MSDDEIIHVCVRAADASEVLAGSRLLACDVCGAPCWVDPRSCEEIPPFHGHGCLACFPIDEAEGLVGFTRGSVERAAEYLRRRRAPWMN